MEREREKKNIAGASCVTTKPSESEKLKFHLPILSQLLCFFLQVSFSTVSGPTGHFSELALGGAALCAYSSVTVFIYIIW